MEANWYIYPGTGMGRVSERMSCGRRFVGRGRQADPTANQPGLHGSLQLRHEGGYPRGFRLARDGTACAGRDLFCVTVAILAAIAAIVSASIREA